MKPSRLYIILIAAVFTALAAVFLALPRSEYSELEKRELAEFPEFSIDKLKGARYPSEVSHWFSDTEPFRDRFMAFSMAVRDKLKFSFGSDEEAITFHATDDAGDDKEPDKDMSPEDIADYENNITANENAKIASAGIIIVGKEPRVRALNVFGGEATGGTAFASVVSQYARELPGIKVYAMVIPLSSEFYMPDKAKGRSKPQLPFIKNIYSHLTGGAKGVNAYTALADHAAEEIYLRTDHHWTPLGAYYAAGAFAKAAGVPFKDLSAYDRRTIRNFVGSMYGYSKDISVKNSPEDFTYYVPKGLNLQTTYRNYQTNKNYQVIKEGPEMKGEFFYSFPDGSSAAYITFMGGDQKLTHVKTGQTTGRRLIIIKDSYGNPVPSYLFYGFDDIYVVDFRYFPHNIKKFAKDNKVTDILFAVDVFNAYSSGSAEKMRRFLIQGDNSFGSAIIESPATAPSATAPSAAKAAGNKAADKPKEEPLKEELTVSPALSEESEE